MIPAGIVTWAEINLDAVVNNLHAYKEHLDSTTEIFAVVKANAYGHGAIPVARAALEAGAKRLAVHRAIEGMELRRAGIDAPILIMGYTSPSGASMIIENYLTPSVITTEFAQALSSQHAKNKPAVPIHIKVDSGMNRYGVLPGELIGFLQSIGRLPGIQIEGIFTHFATADWADSTYVKEQLRTFQSALDEVKRAGIPVPLIHAANSAATMRLPESHFNAVRIGIGMYGMALSSEWHPDFKLQPALTLKSLVTRVRELPAQSAISYGRTFITQKPTRVALVPVGYGDGYHRILSNSAQVLIHGQRAAILGAICMDQFMVDIDAIPDVHQDDEVVLVGSQGEEMISAEEVGQKAKTINYEVTTSLLARVVKIYSRNGQVVEIDSIGNGCDSQKIEARSN